MAVLIARRNNYGVKMVVTNTGRIIGGILGIIIGLLFVASPISGYIRQEASFYDPTTRLISFGFAILGVFMIIANIIQLSKKPASAVVAPAAAVTITPAPVKVISEEKTETENKIKCRFCKKSYSAEYNGCPYCKKK